MTQLGQVKKMGSMQDMLGMIPGPVSYTHLDVYKRQAISSNPQIGYLIIKKKSKVKFKTYDQSAESS